eukprot:UN04210
MEKKIAWNKTIQNLKKIQIQGKKTLKNTIGNDPHYIHFVSPNYFGILILNTSG